MYRAGIVQREKGHTKRFASLADVKRKFTGTWPTPSLDAGKVKYL